MSKVDFLCVKWIDLQYSYMRNYPKADIPIMERPDPNGLIERGGEVFIGQPFECRPTEECMPLWSRTLRRIDF